MHPQSLQLSALKCDQHSVYHGLPNVARQKKLVLSSLQDILCTMACQTLPDKRSLSSPAFKTWRYALEFGMHDGQVSSLLVSQEILGKYNISDGDYQQVLAWKHS